VKERTVLNRKAAIAARNKSCYVTYLLRLLWKWKAFLDYTNSHQNLSNTLDWAPLIAADIQLTTMLA